MSALPRALVPLALSMCLLASARGQDWTEVDHRRRDVEATLDGIAAGDVERRALAAWQLWSWVSEHGDLAREAIRAARVSADVRPLVVAVEAAPATLPPLDGLLARLDVLGAALTVATARGDPLGEAVAYLSFTDALERMDDVDGALAALEARAPDHPWLRAVAATFARRAAVEEVAAALDRLGHPDVRGRARCEVTYTWNGGVTGARGWLLGRDERGLELFQDSMLLRRMIALDPTSRVDIVDAEAERQGWLFDPQDAWNDQGGDRGWSLGYFPVLLVRAAWSLRLGEPLLACRLVRLAERIDGVDDPRGIVVETHHELAMTRTYEVLGRLARGAPRAELALAESGAVDALARALESAHVVDREVRKDLVRDHGRALALRDGLAAQVEEDRLRAAPPSWETWQRWTPEERVACALTFLRDQAGRVWLDKATDAVFPPGSPPVARERVQLSWGSGASVGDRLIELGDAAVPALIELLDDPGPTRSVQGPFALPLSKIAEAILQHMWQAGLLRSVHFGEDPEEVARANQAKAREWLARWGTLGAWHAAQMQQGDDHRRLCHATALLQYDPVCARDLLPDLLAALGPDARVKLARALGDSADAAYAEVHRGLLAASDDALAFEGALGLLRLGDRSGLARACDLAGRGDWGQERVLRVARAGAPVEAGRVILQVSNQRPGGDWELAMRMDGDTPLPPVDAHLALARAVLRSREDGWSEQPLEALRRLACVATTDHDEVLLTVLIAAIPAFVDRPDRQRHAAATVLALGLDAVARFERAGGPNVRPILLAALRSGEADPFDDALGRAGLAAAEWAGAGRDEADRALLRAACVRAGLRVREILGLRDDVHDDVWGWQFAPWDPSAVGPVIAAWRASTTEHPGLELTIERAADLRGVTIRVAALLDREAVTTAHVRAPGLERDGPVDDLGALLREVARALERTPEAPATVRIRAFR